MRLVCVCVFAVCRQWLSSSQQREGWSCTFKKKKTSSCADWGHVPSLCRLPSFPGARSPVAFCRGRSQRARIHNFKYLPQLDRQKVKDNCRLSNNGGARPTQPLSPAATQPFVVPPQHNTTQHAPRRPFTTIISTLTIQLASLPNSHFEAALGIFFFFLFFPRSVVVERALWKKAPNNYFESAFTRDGAYLPIRSLTVGRNVARQ